MVIIYDIQWNYKIEIRDIKKNISDVHTIEHEYLRMIKRN